MAGPIGRRIIPPRKRNSSSRRRIVSIAVFVGAIALGSGVAFLWLRSHDPVVVASNALDGYVRNNPDIVYGSASDYERKMENLDQAKFRKVWSRIVAPSLTKLKFGSLRTTMALNSPATQGVADIAATLPSGDEYKLIATAWVTEGTPCSLVLCDSLSHAWAIEYALGHLGEYRKGRCDWLEARLMGLERDQEFLESLGIPGLVSPSGYFGTWAQYRAQWEKNRLGR